MTAGIDPQQTPDNMAWYWKRLEDLERRVKELENKVATL